MAERSKQAALGLVEASSISLRMAGRLVRFAWGAFAAAAAGEELAVVPPLEPGLNISVVITQPDLEYEGVRTIQSVDDAGVVIGLSWSYESGEKAMLESATRVVRREDLASANRMVASFHRSDPDSFPGSTAIQTSAAVFQALESGADVPVVFGVALGSRETILAARKYYRGALRKAGETPFSLLLNGQRVTVSALHAKGTLAVGGESAEAEFWWLEDPANPLTLRWKFVSDTVQVVRIDTPEPAQAARGDAMAAGLAAETCRAELNGVFFDFGSATLLPASDAALDRVSVLLAEHRDWRVTIEGHTDGIGSDAANQDLSERRSAAVRSALIDRFGVAAASITARGFGETRPLESNETVEGRARNRRVELARDCGANR